MHSKAIVRNPERWRIRIRKREPDALCSNLKMKAETIDEKLQEFIIINRSSILTTLPLMPFLTCPLNGIHCCICYRRYSTLPQEKIYIQGT